MGRINAGRVIIGGLVAGVIANLFDYFINTHLMAEESMANARLRNLDPAVLLGSSVMVTWIVVDFLLGLTLVFTYAAMRPRFGAGPRTAVIAAVTIWFAIGIIVYGFATMGYFTMNVYWKSAIYSLLTMLVAGIAGAAVYKE